MLASSGYFNFFHAYSLADATTVDDISYCKKKDGKIHQRYVSDPIADVNDGSLEITDITVTFKLGKNIEYIGTIGPDYLASKNGDELSVYRVHVFFDVSDDNPTYYSRDGVLYLKSTDEKADCAGFIGEF